MGVRVFCTLCGLLDLFSYLLRRERSVHLVNKESMSQPTSAGANEGSSLGKENHQNGQTSSQNGAVLMVEENEKIEQGKVAKIEPKKKKKSRRSKQPPSPWSVASNASYPQNGVTNSPDPKKLARRETTVSRKRAERASRVEEEQRDRVSDRFIAQVTGMRTSPKPTTCSGLARALQGTKIMFFLCFSIE